MGFLTKIKIKKGQFVLKQKALYGIKRYMEGLGVWVIILLNQAYFDAAVSCSAFRGGIGISWA